MDDQLTTPPDRQLPHPGGVAECNASPDPTDQLSPPRDEDLDPPAGVAVCWNRDILKAFTGPRYGSPASARATSRVESMPTGRPDGGSIAITCETPSSTIAATASATGAAASTV